MPLGFSRLNFFTKPAEVAGGITATGGTTSIETIGGTNYKIHAFTGNGTFEVTAGSGDVDVLLVGGGGSGGGSLDYGAGGGGGGGQTRYETGVSVTGTTYSIVVGAGGAGASSSADKGGDTTGFSFTAEGGGCGGGTEQGKNGESTTNSGAGGGGTAWTSTPGTGGTGSFGGGDAVQGNEAGGGGGGDGSAGADATTTTGGNGGNGVDYSSYFGTSYGASGYFGGGGGGGINISTGGGSGTHGGGNGGDQGSGGNATANTGSGGGGGGLNTSGNKNNGGAGGSGIVLVRYETTETPPTSNTSINLTGGDYGYIAAPSEQSGSNSYSFFTWVKFDASHVGDHSFITESFRNGKSALRVQKQNQKFMVDMFTSTNSNLWRAQAAATFSADTWYAVWVAMDPSDTNKRDFYYQEYGSSTVTQVYSGSNTLWTNNTGTWDTAYYDSTKDIGIGARGANGAVPMRGDLAEFWLEISYVDFSSSTNRQKFVTSGGLPVALGDDGSTPFGAAPEIYLAGSDILTNNRGDSGDNPVYVGSPGTGDAVGS